MGHTNVQSLKKSITHKTIKYLDLEQIDWNNFSRFQCEACLQLKSRNQNHILGSRLKYQHEYYPFEYLHTNVFGPKKVTKDRICT